MSRAAARATGRVLAAGAVGVAAIAGLSWLLSGEKKQEKDESKAPLPVFKGPNETEGKISGLV